MMENSMSFLLPDRENVGAGLELATGDVAPFDFRFFGGNRPALGLTRRNLIEEGCGRKN
jgi:hypothetical protein